jgi:hypothetical protein
VDVEDDAVRWSRQPTLDVLTRAASPVDPSVTDGKAERQELAVFGAKPKAKVFLNASELGVGQTRLDLYTGASNTVGRFLSQRRHDLKHRSAKNARICRNDALSVGLMSRTFGAVAGLAGGAWLCVVAPVDRVVGRAKFRSEGRVEPGCVSDAA